MAETRKVEETETKLRFPLVALDPPWRALGAKMEAAARLWFGKQSASVLRCSQDLTLTYHIFQGDVVVVVEAQYSEGTTHCQR